MKTASTSTEDLFPLTTADKSTSTADLDYFHERNFSNDSSEPDSFGWGEVEYVERQENLTDATKVQVLTEQLQAIQSQSLSERRKFSSTRRYWTDPVLLGHKNNDSALQKASSSPSIMGK